MPDPIKGEAYEFYLSLVDVSNPIKFKAAPTIVAGDFKISKAGGAFANLTTLPTVSPSGGISVKINLSALEMGTNKILMAGIDQAGNEWEDVAAFIDIPDQNLESAADILEGDHDESRTSVTIFKKGTTTKLIEKTITGSLLTEGVVIKTRDT